MNESPITIWQALIPILAPIVAGAIKRFTPKLPRWIVPIIPVALGALADFIMSRAGLSEGNGLMGAILGAAGVFVREVSDQTKKAVSATMQGDPVPRVEDVPEKTK